MTIRERDRLYVLLTVIVLANLASSLFVFA